MWDLIKNDPILKAIFIFVLGIFAFSFAFSIMFGPSQAGMEHGMSSGGYNAAYGLGNIIVLLSKVLIIILLIAIIITAVKFLQKHIVGSEPIKGLDNLKNKPLAAVLVGIGGIILLLLAASTILPSNNSNSMMSSTINYSLGIILILASVVRLITALSFIGVITGLVMHFKSQYFNDVKQENLVSKEFCIKCGTELKAKWKCCPHCGNEKHGNIDNKEDELKINI